MKAANIWKEILADPKGKRHLLEEIKKLAKENEESTQIHFGTSGWRGEIGSDFNLRNVKILAQAIVETVKSEDKKVLNAIGVNSFNEFKERGVIVGHDNRIFGEEFSYGVISIFKNYGVRCYYAGEASTPEFSAAVVELEAAASVNITPSHNPANYGGFKLNPADGGPAPEELTKPIETVANELIRKEQRIDYPFPNNIEKIDLTEIYIKFIKKREMIDLEKIRYFIETEKPTVVIDHMYGTSRGKLTRILSLKPDSFICLRKDNDPLFEGLSPEPSENNLKLALSYLKENSLGFAAIIDPDADRVRFADLKRQIPMNYFGAMAFYYLYNSKGLRGVVAKSVGTSNFVNAIADSLDVEVVETKVGFKNFRPYLLPNASKKAIVAFEESDGISIQNHTLEKDAILGVLLAIEIMANFKMELSDYLEHIESLFGRYYSDRTGIELSREYFGEHIKEKIYNFLNKFSINDTFELGSLKKTISKIITVDGFKLVFTDGSWLMIRPSGTEPKIRIYVEGKSEEEKSTLLKETKRLLTELCM
ncbi:MAG: phosphomannomutase [Thermodesulfovibrio sp.]|nr:phosphomannomutase [Thermodesulfovibrio sp.]